MKDKETTIPTQEEIAKLYQDFQHQLDILDSHLKPYPTFDTTDMDDLLDMLDTGNTLYIDHLNKEMEKAWTETDKPASIEEADLSTLFMP